LPLARGARKEQMRLAIRALSNDGHRELHGWWWRDDSCFAKEKGLMAARHIETES
jgi:hypothetical protein